MASRQPTWGWWPKIGVAILGLLGLGILGLGLSLALWPQPTRRQLLDWYLATPGRKPSRLVLQAVAYHWPTNGNWTLDTTLAAEVLADSGAPLGTLDIHIQGPLHFEKTSPRPQVAAELDSELQVQVQGVKLHPTGTIKLKDSTWFVKLAEPVWPVKGFYTLSETGAQGQWSNQHLIFGQNLVNDLISRTSWSESELVVENGRPLVQLQGEVKSEVTTNIARQIGWDWFQPQSTQVIVQFDPATWQLVHLEMPLEGLMTEPNSPFTSLGAQRLKLHWILTSTPAVTPVSVTIPAEAQPLMDFWQRLEPPTESSSASHVLGAEWSADQTEPRPTELPTLSPWQIELLKKYGFQVESR